MEKYSRLKLLINDKIDNLQNKTVAVIGLGGVGSSAAESLARCGINNLIIVDYDTIELSNINRQLIATEKTIGLKKTDAVEVRINDIDSNIKVLKIDSKLTLDNLDILFDKKIDYLVDAIDDVLVKKEIIRKCIKEKIKSIHVMGTGNKLDPTRLKIQDVRKTNYDPIAKIIRKMVKEEKIKQKIMVVSSDEEKKVTKYDKIPSISFVPIVAGNIAVSYIVNDIVK